MGSVSSMVILLSCVLFLGLNGLLLHARPAEFDGTDVIRMPVYKQEEDPPESKEEEDDANIGTRWAVLLAGSSGYGNYRHQADVCHAYQILRKGGLKEENIIVFMYDDIANNSDNPRPGTIINHPNGTDIYAGVPKDYTGDNVNVNNFLAVLLGDKSSVNGGSGKVVDSGPNDHIFIYYSDHGGPECLGCLFLPISTQTTLLKF